MFSTRLNHNPRASFVGDKTGFGFFEVLLSPLLRPDSSYPTLIQIFQMFALSISLSLSVLHVARAGFPLSRLARFRPREMSYTLRSTLRSVQNQPHDEEFELDSSQESLEDLVRAC